MELTLSLNSSLLRSPAKTLLHSSGALEDISASQHHIWSSGSISHITGSDVLQSFFKQSWAEVSGLQQDNERGWPRRVFLKANNIFFLLDGHCCGPKFLIWFYVFTLIHKFSSVRISLKGPRLGLRNAPTFQENAVENNLSFCGVPSKTQ